MNIDGNRMPKRNQNQCKNASKNKAITGRRKYYEKHENHVFLMCKTMQIHHTVVKKQGLAMWVRDWKKYKKTSKNMSISLPKSMTNLCKNHARKSDANMMEKLCKMEAELEPKSRKMRKNEVRKSMLKKARPPGYARRVGRLGGRP